MNWRMAFIVFRKELIDSLRDRRTIISMIVVPVLAMPLLMFGMGFVAGKQVQKIRSEVPEVMVLGGEHAPEVLAFLQKSERIKVIPPAADYTNLISDKKVRAAVELPAGFAQSLVDENPSLVRVYTYEGEIKSTFATRAAEMALEEYRHQHVRETLTRHNLSASLMEPFSIKQQNVAPPQKVGGSLFGALVPYLVIFMCLVGAMYPAMDLTAGEKERGTIETLLTSPVSRADLVLGKFLMVLTASVSTAVLSVTSTAVSVLVAKNISAGAGIASGMVLSLSPISFVVVLIMILPVAVLLSAAQISIALFAKSYKEAQSYLSPLMMIVIIPATGAMLPGVELNTKLSFIPILNTSLVSKEIVSGNYPWGSMALIFLSTTLYAGIALWTAVQLFKRESVLFRT